MMINRNILLHKKIANLILIRFYFSKCAKFSSINHFALNAKAGKLFLKIVATWHKMRSITNILVGFQIFNPTTGGHGDHFRG